MHHETCPACKWFDEIEVKDSPMRFGRCRARPPVPVCDEEEGISTVWPIVDETDYCGAWERRPGGIH